MGWGRTAVGLEIVRLLYSGRETGNKLYYTHGRSGKVALPRVKGVLAGLASLEVVVVVTVAVRPRRVLRAAVGRRRADDIVILVGEMQ